VTWACVPLALVWLIGAWLVLEWAPVIVGESPIGRKAAPVVAAVWPIAVLLLVAIGGTAALESIWRKAIDFVLPPEDRP
jgi:hypothetical protein